MIAQKRMQAKEQTEARKLVVGVILSGGQAPCGHNVVCGLYDALKATNKENERNEPTFSAKRKLKPLFDKYGIALEDKRNEQ